MKFASLKHALMARGLRKMHEFFSPRTHQMHTSELASSPPEVLYIYEQARISYATLASSMRGS